MNSMNFTKYVIILSIMYGSSIYYIKNNELNFYKIISFKKFDIDTIESRSISGYFLFYRKRPEDTDKDVTIPKEIYDVFYIKNNSIVIDDFSNFTDTLLLDTANYISISSVFGGVWSPLENEKSLVLNYLEKKYAFSFFDQYNFFNLIHDEIPHELIESNKSFISIFRGNIHITKDSFSAEHLFTNMNESNFGTSKTYLLFPSDNNILNYQFSIFLNDKAISSSP